MFHKFLWNMVELFSWPTSSSREQVGLVAVHVLLAVSKRELSSRSGTSLFADFACWTSQVCLTGVVSQLLLLLFTS
jgi:hypothetical protein